MGGGGGSLRPPCGADIAPARQPAGINAEVAPDRDPARESGISVVMHHNDNWSPWALAFRRSLMRVAVAVLSMVSVVLMVAWISLLVYTVHAAAVTTAPVLVTIVSRASQIVQWICSQV